MSKLKLWLVQLPVIRKVADLLGKGPAIFRTSRQYWEDKYSRGGTSGRGSYGELATFKAEFLNEFIHTHQIRSVIEFGCGDGNQLSLMEYPAYTGLDVSPTAIGICASKFANDRTKTFLLYHPEAFADNRGLLSSELALSLDVIFHLIEDDVYEAYMRHLFSAATRYVIVYSTDTDAPGREPHIRHHRFTAWAAQHERDWSLIEHIPNRYPVSEDQRSGSPADFFVFERPAAGRSHSEAGRV